MKTNRPEKPEIHLFWFKKDLRVHDNGLLESWQSLSQNSNSNVGGLGLYVLEEDYWSTDKASDDQRAFVLDSALELKENLKKLGGELLIIKQGSASEAISLLTQFFSIKQISAHRETANKWTFDRDKSIIRMCNSLGIIYTEIPQDSLVRAANSKVIDFSTRYYDFANKRQFIVPTLLKSADTSMFLRNVSPNAIISSESAACSYSPFVQRGGEANAITNLVSFLETRCLGQDAGYRKEMSTPLTAHSACSRISPHLTWGSLSARAAYQTARSALNSLGHHDPRIKHIQSFITRLAWRSHFMQKFETLHWMEFKCINPKSETLHGWDTDAFEAWKSGMTGYPFVDACMRSLNQTKWLNFRARAMVVSFASYALNLDWRLFGPYLAQNFLDYEPGIHYSQLQMQGGTTLGSPPRIYNPLKQSIEKDPSGEFIRQWVPELQDCPDSIIHLPSDYPRKNYPPSIVDHTRLWAIMRGNAPKSPTRFKSKNGSKQSTGGFKRTFKPTSPAAPAASQLEFDLVGA
jgi:deoxyribodipyrimidine photo-lyase